MKMNLILKIKYILKFSFFIILNIIICLFIFKNFSYIYNKCDIIIINNIFYFITIFFFALVINLFYVLFNNLYEKKILNLCLTILTISTIIILILTLYLKNKVDISKLSEIFYNVFLQIKVIKIVWNQEELMTIGQQYIIEKNYKISQEILLDLITKIKNPEQLIEKLNLISINTLKKTTILDTTLNFLYNHKYKIILGTGVAILSIASASYIIPILISKSAVAPIIEVVQKNPIIEIGSPEHILSEAFKLLDQAEREAQTKLDVKIDITCLKFNLMVGLMKDIKLQLIQMLTMEKNLFKASSGYGTNMKMTTEGCRIFLRNLDILDGIISVLNESIKALEPLVS